MSQPSKAPQAGVPRVVYAGLALVVLLGIVAVASRGHEPPTGSEAGHARAPVQYFFDIAFTLAIVAVLATVVFFAFVRASGATKPRKVDFRSIFVIAAFVALLSLSAVLIGQRLAQRNGAQQPTTPLTPKIPRAGSKNLEQAEAPKFHWPAAAGTLALLAAGLAFLIARERSQRTKGARERLIAEQLAEVLDETLDDLRAEPDPRRAVIAAYARMERVLAAHGLPRHGAEAPLEYLARILEDLDVGKRAIEGLTELFAEAKFSEHAISPGMKERAIRSLESLRDDLRARSIEEEQEPEPAALLDHGGLQ